MNKQARSVTPISRARGPRHQVTGRRRPLAYRVRFDPVLAAHTSLVEPLPHQITAVCEAMRPRQPLRFLLARAADPR